MTKFELGEKVKFTNIVKKRHAQHSTFSGGYKGALELQGYEVDRSDFKYPENAYSITTYSEYDSLRKAYPVPSRSWVKKYPTYSYNDQGFYVPDQPYEHETKIFNEGIIIGVRTVSEWEVDAGGWEESSVGIIIRDTSRPVYLVSYNLHRSPVMVWPKHLERIDNV